jgi:uncharacterized protein with PIN domain
MSCSDDSKLTKFQLEPKILICSDCGYEFVHTGAAREYLIKFGVDPDEEPTRCHSCRKKYKNVHKGCSVREELGL